LKICKKCIQPDTLPAIHFENGVCGGCLWQTEKNNVNWDSREKELDEIVNCAKTVTKSNYDCVIGVSGGKDSTWQALTCRDRLDLRCLLVNCEPEGLTEIGKRNMENLKNLGFDVISIRPNPQIMKKIIKRDFFKYLNAVKPTEYPLWASTYIIADKFNIPLIMQGENPALVFGTSEGNLNKGSDSLDADQLQTISTDWRDYQEIDGISEKDLFFYHYDKKKLKERGVRGVWMNYFLKEWDNSLNAKFAQKNGFEYRSFDYDPYSEGTPCLHSNLDAKIQPVNQMLKSIKLGFGQAMPYVCAEIRSGKMSRDEAIDIVINYDGKCSNDKIDDFCNYLEITIDEFWNTAEKFRGKMWVKNKSNKWQNKFHDVLLSQKSQ
jgi:N-acetyl sugar amidotransferase